jgi:hypothetical protein
MDLARVPDRKCRLEFPWHSLTAEQKARLLIAIGDCDGEWWGEGRAEFPTWAAAAKALEFAVRLQVVPGS